MATNPKIKYVQKEFIEIYDAFKNNIDINIINESYENYSPNMHDFIKTKDLVWFDMFFAMINTMLNLGISKKNLKKNLLSIKNSNKNIVRHIVDIIYEEDIIEEDIIEQNNERNENNENNENNEQNEQNEQNENNAENVNNEQNEGLNDIAIEEVINNFTWRKNQVDAINNTIKQNFCSGIHNQIMGAGKTFIILNTISEHNKLIPNKKLYIITSFRQEILKELMFNNNGQININKLNTFKTNNVIDLDNFHIINRVHNKNKNIIISKTKPTILIINTDYLKTMHKNNKIDYNNVNFVILDECHSVSAPKFYSVLEKIKYVHKVHIIGFSATPLREKAETKLIDIFSMTTIKNDTNKKLNIISNYDFINAIRDNIILPPCYVLCEVNKTLNGRIGKENKQIMKKILENTIKNVPYKKIIGWCRSINNMKEYYKFIKDNFTDFSVYCSSCCDKKLKELGYNTNFEEYMQKQENAILLCVNRCREGSDIMNLDTAIYLDIVSKRSLLVALQTSGRVLRKDKDNKKTCGIIIDSFINHQGIQIEVLTANKILNYYKKIFSLCDISLYTDQKKAYEEMLKICNKIEYDNQKEELTLKLDDEKKHNITFKLELKTLHYDYNNFIVALGSVIDKMFNISRDEKFDKIIDTIKQTNILKINTINFNEKYDTILDKEKLNIPLNSKLLYDEFKDKFDVSNWYNLLGLDTSRWYQNKNECIMSLNKLCKDKITDSNYRELRKKDKKLPVNPFELYKLSGFMNIEKEFNTTFIV